MAYPRFVDVTALPTATSGTSQSIHRIRKIGQADQWYVSIRSSSGSSYSWKSLTSTTLNVKDFGAKGDGVKDDTVAIQAWVNALVANHLTGIMPAGNYKITSRIEFSQNYGWSIVGAGSGQTIVTQATDNTAVFWLGNDALAAGYGWTISGIQFTYTNVQAAANTNAVCVAFNKEFYLGKMDDLAFQRGAWGIKVVAAVPSPWGCDWTNLRWASEVSVGAIDNATNDTAGTPNNHWGKFYVRADAMIGPIFEAKGYNWTIDSIEVNIAGQGPKLLRLASGSEVSIGALKLENATYNAAGNQFLIEGLANSTIVIDQMSVGGNAVTIGASAVVYAIQSGGGGATFGAVEAGIVRLGGSAISGKLYAFGGTPPGGIRCGQFVSQDANARLSNNTSSGTNEILTVNAILNHRISTDKGDADYTVALKDPNYIQYETVLTAIRTVNLPSDGDNLFNGVFYEINAANGVINGTNTIVVKCGATTLATLATNKTVARFTWRRNATVASGWRSRIITMQ